MDRRRGFTLIELLVVMAIVALLGSLVAPKYFASLERGKEAALKQTLATVRDAIDQFAADTGRLPDSLQELVAARYLREVPEDPVLRRRDRWVEVAPPPSDALPGRLHDIRSGAASRGSDGRLYSEW